MSQFADEIMVEKVLTQEEVNYLLTVNSEEDKKTWKPIYFDDNQSEWAEWLYKNGYRLVKLPK